MNDTITFKCPYDGHSFTFDSGINVDTKRFAKHVICRRQNAENWRKCNCSQCSGPAGPMDEEAEKEIAAYHGSILRELEYMGHPKDLR